MEEGAVRVVPPQERSGMVDSGQMAEDKMSKTDPLPLQAASLATGVSTSRLFRWMIGGSISRIPLPSGDFGVVVAEVKALLRRLDRPAIAVKERPLAAGECWSRHDGTGRHVRCSAWQGVFATCWEGYEKCERAKR